MRTTVARALLCLTLSCIGCASTEMIHGTISTRPPVGMVIPSQEPNADHALVHGSVVDAVVYIEELHPRVESGSRTQGSSRLELKDQTFRPRILVVPVGTSVEFANHDSL